MDAQAVAAALSPKALAPPIAKTLGLPADAVAAALELLAGGAQPAFVAHYRPERIGDLAIRDLERIQALAARAAAFEFKRQDVAGELEKRRPSTPFLTEHLASATHLVDFEDLQSTMRRRKRGPAAKARAAGLLPAAATMWIHGSTGVMADAMASKTEIRPRPAAEPEPEPQPEPTDAEPTDAAPTDAAPTDPAPTDAAPTDAAPADAEPADAEPAAPVFDVAAIVAAIGPDAVTPDDAACPGIAAICGEHMTEHPPLRRRLRDLVLAKGRLRSVVVPEKKDKAARYTRFFDFSEPAKNATAAQILALHRAEREGLLRVDLELDDALVRTAAAGELGIDGDKPAGAFLLQAADDAWRHGLGKAVKAGVRKLLKERADREAIGEFAEALRPLLLAPALGKKTVLAIDAGHQNGCKLAVIGESGELVTHDTVFPLEPKKQVPQARGRITELCQAHGVTTIAIGTSAAGRELERICRTLVRDGGPSPGEGAEPVKAAEPDKAAAQEAATPESAGDGEAQAASPPPAEPPADAKPQLTDVVVTSMDADAAALFASSRAAKDELAKSDAALRRAVAIGRRVQDPLRELIKVDPRKLGLGQYQHEVDQEELRHALEQVTTSCVSDVTVDVDTVDADRLARVAGLSHALAKAIVGHREAKGPFRSRTALLEVPGFAGKAFEQAAGFLRVFDGEQPLDTTMIHPERYAQVTQMARDLGVIAGDLLGNDELVGKISGDGILGTPGVSGEPLGPVTFQRILDHLRTPAKDPRPPFESVEFNPDLGDFEDLQVGMELEGIVTHLASFGAFVDVGIAQDGLVHVSELSHEFISSPLDAVHVGQKVKGRVIEIAPDKKRFSLSIKALLPRPDRPPKGKEGRGGKRRKDGKGKPGRKDGKDNKGKPQRQDRTLGFRMDLSDLASLLDKG